MFATIVLMATSTRFYRVNEYVSVRKLFKTLYKLNEKETDAHETYHTERKKYGTRTTNVTSPREMKIFFLLRYEIRTIEAKRRK